MKRGWLRLWRKYKDSPTSRLPPFTQLLFFRLMLLASRKDTEVRLGDKVFQIRAGEIVTSYAQLGEALTYDENNKEVMPSKEQLRWAMSQLVKAGNIEVGLQHGLLWVKVLRWGDYQGEGDTTQMDTEQVSIMIATTGSQQSTEAWATPLAMQASATFATVLSPELPQANDTSPEGSFSYKKKRGEESLNPKTGGQGDIGYASLGEEYFSENGSGIKEKTGGEEEERDTLFSLADIGLLLPSHKRDKEVEEVWNHWVKVMWSGHGRHPVLNEKRKGRIKWALTHYSKRDCLDAIDGCRADPFSMGQNDRKTKYNDVTIIFRDSTHTERFLAMADAGSTHEQTERDTRISRACMFLKEGIAEDVARQAVKDEAEWEDVQALARRTK